MHQLWTSACLALVYTATLSLAYPQQSTQQSQSWQDLRQYSFDTSHRHTSYHKDNDLVDTYARFDNDKVYRLEVSSLDQLNHLEAAVETLNLDLWSNLRIGKVDVRVPAPMIDIFQRMVTRQIPSTVMVPNLQDLVTEQTPSTLSDKAPKSWNYTDSSFWMNYHDLETLNNFTESMIEGFPNLVKRVSIGQTFEGREVFGMSIHGFVKPKKSDQGYDVNETEEEEEEEGEEETQTPWWWSKLFGYSGRANKKPSKPKKHPKAILIHAGQHAREWIGPAVVTYIANELILGYGHSKKITRLVDQFEFIIVPVLNADGYAYTWETNRMWRKNRQPTSIPFCVGIDPNRNWGYKWNTGGSSDNPCNEGYHGPEAFAAKESKMMADFILAKKNVVAYIDFHAYSQLWMSPFGGDCSEVPKDDEDILEGGLGAAKALHSVHGKKYAVGNVCDVIYQASGGSIDWTYAVGKVKYSYGVELRDTGRYGFLLPESEIIPSCEETTAGVIYLANFIRMREKQWGYLL
ncbi:Carboxypeptidase A4 [Entomortierella beljakovae]|nr:Carboxypeptidase A4 [Entomortierella beljakovae]